MHGKKLDLSAKKNENTTLDSKDDLLTLTRDVNNI